jgi:hypothetical protein
VSVITLLRSSNPSLSSRALFLISLAVTYVAERRFIRKGGVIRGEEDKKVRPVSSLLRRSLNR